MFIAISCVVSRMELEPAVVASSGASVDVIVASGQLVQPDGRGGLERIVVESPIRAVLFEDGRLLGAVDGSPVFARLVGAEPYAWLRPGQWLSVDGVEAAWVPVPARVPVVRVEADQVWVALPFEAPDGGPVLSAVSRSQLVAEHPEPPLAPSMAIHGRLEHDRRVLVQGPAGQPLGWTWCGSVRFVDWPGVLQLRGGIELRGRRGPDGPPCPARPQPEGLTDPPDGWVTASRSAAEREAFTEALFAEGATLFTAEDDSCIRWTVEAGDEGPELARRWEDDTYRNRESINVRPAGSAAVLFARRWVQRERLVPATTGIGLVSTRPLMLCGEMPASIVDFGLAPGGCGYESGWDRLFGILFPPPQTHAPAAADPFTSVLHIHGEADRLIAWDGFSTDHDALVEAYIEPGFLTAINSYNRVDVPVDDMLYGVAALWADPANGWTSVAAPTAPGAAVLVAGVSAEHVALAPSIARVRILVVTGGGHEWAAQTTYGFDAITVMWNFFLEVS